MIDTDEATAERAGRDSGVARYVLYLDGIAQSSAKYTPDIETFLDALAPELPARRSPGARRDGVLGAQ